MAGEVELKLDKVLYKDVQVRYVSIYFDRM